VVSKCANPECSEPFRFLHQGKLFHLAPAPGRPTLDDGFVHSPCERFWLCDRCSKIMTMVWEGTEAKLVPLPPKRTVIAVGWREPKKHAANAGGPS